MWQAVYDGFYVKFCIYFVYSLTLIFKRIKLLKNQLEWRGEGVWIGIYIQWCICTCITDVFVCDCSDSDIGCTVTADRSDVSVHKIGECRL